MNFFETAVSAIESRDPSTSGHSKRVAKYCLHLSKTIENNTNPFYSLTFNQIQELYYVAILHDFGKIFVKEKILTLVNKFINHNIYKIILNK